MTCPSHSPGVGLELCGYLELVQEGSPLELEIFKPRNS